MNISTITITFGDVAENHVRMQKLGTLAKEGFSIEELNVIMKKFTEAGCDCELVHLPFVATDGVKKDFSAAVLVIRNGVDALLNNNGGNSKDMFAELSKLNWDKKAKMKGKVVNKHARWNLCFDKESQEPDYAVGKGRIIPYKDVPLTKIAKDRLKDFIDKGENLVAEGNLYYNVNKCYIGAHGDGERRMVVGLRLGATFPLHFQWYLQGSPVGLKKTIQLSNGDLYVMSDVAVGWNWLKRTVPTLRHSAGFPENLK